MRPRVAFICHHDMPLHYDGISRWLASWAELTGLVVVKEPPSMLRKRVRREMRRVGALRLVDVLAQRLYYRAAHARRDRDWVEEQHQSLRARYPELPPVPTACVASPNGAEAQRVLAEAKPDLVLALSKNILAERIFSIPTFGTFVLHPGICPEYRNAHGCFWALASDDLDRVGMTLLRIDRGIDTGPVFGYFHAAFDEVRDSHIVIQHRMTLDNLGQIADRLKAIVCGTAQPLSVAGRESYEWGQPWLSKYVYWKRQARRRRDAHRDT